MKLLVIGAGGKTGKRVIEYALAAGHSVNALLHSAPKDEDHAPPAGVKVFTGDVNNPLTLKEAMEGCNAVVDAIGGSTPFLKTSLETDAARAVLQVMPAVGAKRLIVVSVAGIGDGAGQVEFLYEKILIPTFLHGASKDKLAMEDEVKHSDVDWTIVRPPTLSDSDPTGNAHVVEPGEKAHKITRADLAQWIVDQLLSTAYVHQVVTVANT